MERLESKPCLPGHQIQRILAVLLVSGVIVLVLALYGLLSVAEERVYSATEETEESFACDAAPHVVVETYWGDILVTVVDTDAVKAKVVKQGQAVTKQGAKLQLGKISTIVSSEVIAGKQQVLIRATKNEEKVGDLIGETSISVQVPYGSTLELWTRNGVVDVTGPAGAVKAFSGWRIRVSGASGSLDLHSIVGDIVVDFGKGSMELRSNHGGVTVRTERALANILAHGDIHFVGDLSDGEHQFCSTKGQIQLDVPQDIQVEFDAQSDQGRVTNWFRLAQTQEVGISRVRGVTHAEPRAFVRARSIHGDIVLRSTIRKRRKGYRGTVHATCCECLPCAINVPRGTAAPCRAGSGP